MSQRDSFGGAGRIPPVSDVGGIIVAPLVSIVGRQVDNTGATVESGVVGIIIPDADSRPPNLNGAPARWMTAAALGYAYSMVDDNNDIDRLRAWTDSADNQATTARGLLMTLARGSLFDNATWDRARSASAANIAATTGQGAAIVSLPGMWSQAHTPAAATQATTTRAAIANVRHVCTSISAFLTIQPTINQPVIQVNLRDGATGAGTILWSRNIGIGAALANGGEQEVSLSGLSIVGSVNTDMTLEFSAAGAAGTIQSVAMTGYEAT